MPEGEYVPLRVRIHYNIHHKYLLHPPPTTMIHHDEREKKKPSSQVHLPNFGPPPNHFLIV